MTLRCETNTLDVSDDIGGWFTWSLPTHLGQLTFEHGQWFVTCLDCGQQWSVNDAEKNGEHCFEFEALGSVDELCEEVQ